ncbi:MAG: BMC domain-containing protein [Eubacteriales bacterium]
MTNAILNRYALGIVEFTSIPIGYRITNEMLKTIGVYYFVDILAAKSKYVALIMDKYEKVEHALDYAIGKEDNSILDIALIGNVHEDLQLFINKENNISLDSIIDLGVIKTETFSSCIENANQILHFVNVSLIDINYSDSLYGDCLITFHGNTSNVQAALDKVGMGELISKPDKKLLERILRSEQR